MFDKIREWYGGGKSMNAVAGFLALAIVAFCKSKNVDLPFTDTQISVAFLTLLGVQGAVGKAIRQ